MDLKYYKQYCKDIENVENYYKAKKDSFKGWHCHHRLQTWTSDGERREVNISAAELKALGMYYNRPASELIFLTESEHSILHNKGESHPMYGKHHSAETIKKLSKVMKGKNKGKPKSDEHKKKLSEANKGKFTGEKNPAYGKLYHLGKHWYHNDKENKLCYECPDGFTPGRLKK